MATLTGNAINTSYEGLLKTLDNAAINGVNRVISDGVGNALPLEASTTTIKFTGNADFTSATVTGIAAGGLVSGTGTDSMKTADALLTNNATASGPQAIALGNGAQATSNQSIAIGNFAESTSVGTAAIGEYASAGGIYASAWGRTASAGADGSVAFGQQTNVPFGVNGGVALGRQVEADLSDTTHVRALKIVAPDGGTGGNGITLLSPNGTAGLVTLLDTSELALDGTAIGGGGGGAAGLVAGSAGTNSIKSADSLGTVANVSSADNCIAIGNNLTNDVADSISIGDNIINSGQGRSIFMGQDWNHTYGADCVVIGNGQDHVTSVGQDDMIGIGRVKKLDANGGVAIGHGSEVHGASNGRSVAIGYEAKAGTSSVHDRGVAIGNGAQTTVTDAVALGANVTATVEACATVNMLQIANYANLNYADDTAAAAGGVALGQVYHNAGALRIRIA